MRKKSEEKMQEIVDAAFTLFMKQGYERTSINDILGAVGGSKATIYNYFSSKEELFAEVMLCAAHKLGSKVFNALESDAPLRRKIEALGKAYLDFILSAGMVDIRRTFISAVHTTGMGKVVYERGIKAKWMKVAAVLEREMKAGLMRRADSWTAAMQLRSLFDADLVDRRLLGVDKSPDKERINQSVLAATDIFCAYYEIA